MKKSNDLSVEEAMEQQFGDCDKNTIDDEINLDYSNKYKRGVNRIMREILGSDNIIYPEVDSVWERLRSRIRRIFKK